MRDGSFLHQNFGLPNSTCWGKNVPKDNTKVNCHFKDNGCTTVLQSACYAVIVQFTHVVRSRLTVTYLIDFVQVNCESITCIRLSATSAMQVQMVNNTPET